MLCVRAVVPETLYNEHYVKTADYVDGVRISEIATEALLLNIDTLTKIKRITRQKSYKTLSHEALAKDVNLESSNRSEELMVIWQRNFRAWQGVRFSDSFEKCTYWCIADRQKLLGDFGYPNAELRKGILAYNPSRPYTDFNECKKVRELMVKLDVDFFVLSADNTRVIPFGAVSTTAPDIGDTSGAKTP